MTSRTSETSRLERTAALCMIAPRRQSFPERDSGTAAGNLVYNAVSTGISRVFRELQEINGFLSSILVWTEPDLPA
jgi:hypothetical protein